MPARTCSLPLHYKRLVLTPFRHLTFIHPEPYRRATFHHMTLPPHHAFLPCTRHPPPHQRNKNINAYVTFTHFLHLLPSHRHNPSHKASHHQFFHPTTTQRHGHISGINTIHQSITKNMILPLLHYPSQPQYNHQRSSSAPLCFLTSV